MVLIGDFCGWEPSKGYELSKGKGGTWEVSIPDQGLAHRQHYKLQVFWRENEREICAERIPSFCRRVVQDPETNLFCAQVWEPPQDYSWKHPHYRAPQRAPLIYEAHVGMAQEEGRVGTYGEFTRTILPKIHRAGYNTIQLMAIQEHPYYGSFGYQVSNFFAPSSRFGTPEELKELVDTAHSLDIAVIMDLVHSHAVSNELEGLSRFDGSYTLYFHDGSRGHHPAWNTRLFDYGKSETLHLLLSNCRYWLDAFKFDGFRFDGVTSMIYRDHGLGSTVTSYDHYFNQNVDSDAVSYLTLANELIHELRPDALTIAEEVSGIPGLAAPPEVGGCGFNYRLSMGVPDYWIKLLKHTPDEEWDVSSMWRELSARRPEERTIGYAESHDQAMVGDKTIMFWLADKEMYWKMGASDQSVVIDRAIALHKIIRLITLATAGSGYLNFMGNEFGHPEWIDFPREGNAWSYHYARRLWSLQERDDLRYKALSEFDRAMIELAGKSKLLESPWPHKHYEHVLDSLLAFERGGLYFVFNFHPENSYTEREMPFPKGAYTVALSSDEPDFGGFGRIDTSMSYTTPSNTHGVKLYLPSRTAIVLRPA